MLSNIKRNLGNPYLFSVITKVLLALVGSLFVVIQARYLGAYIKGEVAYINSITAITSIVLGFGIHQAYPYLKKKSPENLRPLFLRMALMYLLVYILLAIGLIIILEVDEQWVAIILITPVMVYNKIVSYLVMIDHPNRKNAVEAIINILVLLMVIVMYFLVPASFVAGALLVLIKDLLMAFSYTWSMRSDFRISYRLRLPKVLELIRFGFFPMLALLMTTLNYRVDIIMLEGYVTSDLVGVYSIGVMLAERVWMIPDAMKDVMLSRVAKGADKEEVAFVIRVSNTACLVVVLGIIVLGEPLIRFIFGSEFQGAYEITVIILIGVFFMIYYKIIASYNIVMGKQVINFIFLSISVLTNIIGNRLLIPVFGNQGAAFSSILSYGICALCFVVHFVRTTNVPLYQMFFVNRGDLKRIQHRFSKRKYS
jgi:O-antigen/teichoic acid export membrane protein